MAIFVIVIMRVSVRVVRVSVRCSAGQSRAQAADEEAQTNDEDDGAGDEAEDGEEPLRVHVVGREEGDETEREDPGGVRDGDGQTEECGVLRRALRADEVRADHRLAVTR